jgi:hypothetical protein
VTRIFCDTQWLGSGGRALLCTAYARAREALQSEAALTDVDLDTLTGVMTGALLSLYRAGQVDETRLSNYAVAITLRHLSVGQR